MKDIIQYEKAKNKLDILEELFINLTEYNNMTNYTNNKKFKLKMDYIYDDVEKCYKYVFKLFRGINNPNNILEIHIKYKNKINELLKQLLERIISNKNFLYFSSNLNENKMIKSFSVNMKEEVSLELEVKDEEDKKLYDNIMNKYNRQTIIIQKEKENISENEKDDLQIEKAKKIIQIIKNVLNNLNEYNSIENYNNKKQFKLVVTNQEIEDYTKFNFKIIRGNYNDDVILDLSLSIKDTLIIYNELYEMMMHYVSQKEFLYNSIGNSSYKKHFNINLNNNITLNFEINSTKDELFYNNFFMEYRHEILERQKHSLKRVN